MTGDFEPLEIGRLTWIGLILAAIGWALMLGEAAFADLVILKTVRPLTPTFHGDLFDIAKCLIGSGFALAVVGALHAGFGTLNRFFSAVLNRSTRRGDAEPQEPAPIRTSTVSKEPARGHRPYRTFPDGSVEVETIVGTRRFDTMADAREFI